MNLEGKIYGYSKKTLAIIVLVLLVAGVMFYAGAKYEKRKLTSLGLLKTSGSSNQKKKAPKPADTATPPQDGTTTPTAPSDQSTTPTTTPAAPATAPASPKNY